MKLGALGRTNRSYGSGPWRAVADMMEVDLPDFGSAISQIWVEIYCNGYTPVHQSFPPGFEPWRPAGIIGPTYFPPLDLTPDARILRKKGELQIRYPSVHFTPQQARDFFYKTMTREALGVAKAELREALSWGLSNALRKTDDFDSDGFLIWFDNWRGLEIDTHRDIYEIWSEAEAERKRRRAAADPWSLLDVDWRKMHQDASKLLDHPEDWSGTDGFAPHGSDTGADIWADWASYSRLTPTKAAQRMGWDPMNPEVRELMERDWFEIHLALAFGHVKRKATCPPELARATCDLLEACGDQADRIAPDKLPEWKSRVMRYRKILEAFCTP